MRQPGPCVRALCEAVAQMLSKNMTCARPRRNATPSEHFPHASQCTLHTLHFALDTSSHLKSRELFSPHLSSSYLTPDAFRQKSLSEILCTTKLAQSTSQYYFVLQSLRKALPSTTLYYKACTKHVPVLFCTTRLAQSTSQSYFALQSLRKALPSTPLYYKACTKHY